MQRLRLEGRALGALPDRRRSTFLNVTSIIFSPCVVVPVSKSSGGSCAKYVVPQGEQNTPVGVLIFSEVMVIVPWHPSLAPLGIQMRVAVKSVVSKSVDA